MDEVKRIIRESRDKWGALIMIDVQNAFNTARWEEILSELRRRWVPTYLRKICTDYLNQRNWMGIHGLKIAPEKSKAILLRSRGRPGQLSFKIGEHTLALSKTLIYLGVTLDNHGTFGAHVTRVTNKANTKMAKLARLLSNIAGPNSKKRAMLYETVQSIVL
ncbi:hypothetical protein ILUMI_15917, partial [Ignelater luminosus]